MFRHAVPQFRIAAAAVLIAIAAAVVPAAAASAHDQLLESSPTEGQRFERAPETVSLTFNSDVLTVGARVVVVDESGKDWVVGDTTLNGAVVTASMPDALPVGGYQVRWRVVSGDGHPITGVIPFTVGDAQPYRAEKAAGTTGTEQGSTPAPAEGSADDGGGIEQTRAGGPDIGRLAIVGGVGAATALLVFGAITFVSGRRRGGGDRGGHLS